MFSPIISTPVADTDWAGEELASAVLHDLRLNNRAIHTLRTLFTQASSSIPAACRTMAEVKGTYRLLANNRVTYQALLTPHFKQTVKRVRAAKIALLISDLTEINLTGKKVAEQLGYIGDNKTKGLFLQPLLAVTPERIPLGLLDVHTFLRTDISLSAKQRKHIPFIEKETYGWLREYQLACQHAATTPDTQFVYITDRGGCIHELFHDHHIRAGAGRADFLIRGCAVDRRLSPTDDDDHAQEAHLFAQIATMPILSSITFTLPATEHRAKRAITQQVKAGRVWIKAPYRKDKSVADAPMNVVALTETEPPAGQEPATWLLFTSLPVDTAEQIETIIDYYLARWEIELFFKVLKSGCQIEELYLQSPQAIYNALALYLIITWRLLWCTRLGGACPALPCTVVYTDDEWQAIYYITEQQEPPEIVPTLQDITHRIARCGGFLCRPSDGNPGIKTMWIGLRRLYDFVLAFKTFGPKQEKTANKPKKRR